MNAARLPYGPELLVKGAIRSPLLHPADDQQHRCSVSKVSICCNRFLFLGVAYPIRRCPRLLAPLLRMPFCEVCLAWRTPASGRPPGKQTKGQFVWHWIQVNGKMRGTVTVAADIDQAGAVEAGRGVPNVSKQLDGKDIKKIIFVSGKILNFIIAK